MEKLSYKHLSSEERDKIAYLRAQGKSISEIADSIGRNKGSVSRELKRNGSPVYNVYLANRELHTIWKLRPHHFPLI